MTLEEYILSYNKLERKEMTKIFNEFSVKQRLEFLEVLSDSSKEKFIDSIRQQAVDDFWYHEREAILNGTSTRDWTPEQIESIMNISEKTGKMSVNAGKAPVMDADGVILIDKNKKSTYYGHHMIDVSTHPEYAGDWRNIQALDYNEHYYGAHPNHDTKTSTKGYYDVENKITVEIDVTVDDFDFDDVGYPPKRKCIFKSDADMRAMYSNYDKLTAGEQLALKNVDLAMKNGDVDGFNNALKLAEKYKSKDFCEKVGIKTVDEIKQMYSILEGCDDADVINKYRLYEYATRHGYDTNMGIYDGLVDDAKLSELFGENRYNNFTASEKEQAAELSNKLQRYLNSTDSQDGTSEGTTSKENTVGDTDSKQDSFGNSDNTSESDTKHTGSSDYDGTKSNTTESSDKISGTKESSIVDDSSAKKTETGEVDVKDGDTTKHTGTTDSKIMETADTKHTGIDDISENSASSKKGMSVDLESESTKRYLAATGKTVDDLNDMDKTMLKIANKFANNPNEASEFAKSLSKYDNLIKVGEKVGGFVDVACTAFFAAKSIYDASQAYKNGDTSSAIGIVAGALTEFAVGAIGGAALTSVLAPYFMGFGAAIGGPIGAGIGALVAGILGYGLAGTIGENWNEMIQSWFVGLDEASMMDAMTFVYDPLILDLNGDGNYTKKLSDGTHFDFMGSGFAEKTGWVSEEDGLLIHDLNKNGVVDDGSELFGDMTQMSNGEVSHNGFQALSDLDSNGDGVINAEDVLWGELQVWQDKNSDGISQTDELYSLEDLGIQRLNLDYTSQETDNNGNLVTKVGSYVTDDNMIHTMAEVSFAVDTMDTIQNETIEVSEEIENLPDLRGSGKMGTLHQAMAKNEELKNMVQEFVQTTNSTTRRQLIQDIVKCWADCGDVEPGSRGEFVDAEHLAIIEKFYGRVYKIMRVTPAMQREMETDKGKDILKIISYNEEGDNPDSNSAVKLENIYAKLLADVSRQIMAQTDLALPIAFTLVKEKENQSTNVGFSCISENVHILEQKTETDSTKEIDYTFAKAFFTERLKEDIEGTVELMREYTRFIKESKIYKEYFSLEGIQQAFADSEVLLAAIETYNYSGYYYGTNDLDDMSGKNGSEIFFMGAGDDIVRGNNGNDTLYGESGADRLYGGNGNDILVGGAGNDYMEGGSGEDTYIHNLGDGDDIINNYDTSEERKKDRLIFGEGIQAEDIQIIRENSNMVLTNTKTGEKVTVQNAYYYTDGRCYLENIGFADGTVWAKEKIQEATSVIAGGEENDSLYGYTASYGYSQDETFYGGAGDDWIQGNSGNDSLYGESGADRLYGGNGNDILVGGAGNDYMEGGSGEDTYIHNLGDGDDIINNYDTSEERKKDRLIFGEGIQAEDIQIIRENSNMVLTNTKTGEKVTIENAYCYADGRCYLENIEFADGTVWTKEKMQEAMSVITGGEGNDSLYGYTASYGYGEDETFYGGAGNDMIQGNTGNDTLYGENGADSLYGGNGNDSMYGESGADRLYGGNGNDILVGGAGNDYMEGGSGADTYIHNLGDGDDIINNYDTSEERKKDRLIFGEGIQAEDIQIIRENSNMVLTNTKTGEKVTIENAYCYADGRCYLENIGFADGTVWTKEKMQEAMSVITGGEGNDSLYGYTASYGYGEDETFYGGAGNDMIQGNTGNDTLYGENGADSLYGGNGNDSMYGESGADRLYGGNGNDILVGGAGNDYMEGGSGADTYIHNLGDGDDIINNYDTSEERKKDRLVFGEGIQAEDIQIIRENSNMVLTNTKTGEKVTIENAYCYVDGRCYLENIEFADGTVWTKEKMQEAMSVITGGEGNDSLYGYTASYGYGEDETFYGGAGNDMIQGNTGNDTLYGENGADSLYGGNGNDSLYGENGADRLYGENGNDILVGGAGNDYLDGGRGNDTYIFNQGDGSDTIYDYDNTLENEDVLQIGTDAKTLFFTKSGSNLLISILDTDDKITIANWYSDDNYKIENIKTSDGYTLSHTQVDLLIQSMASFESSLGMSWSDAIRQENADIDGMIAQIWVKQVG